ncbi:diguanylate cyclase [Myxococcota bacterium]|nr:diguanylate cyclase [Myxococcota bacterium]
MTPRHAERLRRALTVARAGAWPLLLLSLLVVGASGTLAGPFGAVAAAALLLLGPHLPRVPEGWRPFLATSTSRALAGLELPVGALLLTAAIPEPEWARPVWVVLAFVPLSLARGLRGAALPVGLGASAVAAVPLAGLGAGAGEGDAAVLAVGALLAGLMPGWVSGGGAGSGSAGAASPPAAAGEAGPHRVGTALEEVAGPAASASGALVPAAPVTLEEFDGAGAYSSLDRDRDREALGRRLHSLMSSACEALVAGTGATRCLVYRPVEDGGAFELAASSSGPGAARRRIDGREGLLGAVRKSRDALLIPEVRPDYAGLLHAGSGDEVGSVLVAPLVEEDQLWGVLVMDAPGRGALGMRDRELVRRLCPLFLALVAQVIELSVLKERERLAQGFAAAVKELSRHVRRADVGKVLVEVTADLAPSDLSAVAALEGEGDAALLRIVAATGAAEGAAGAAFAAEPGEGLLAQALRHGAPIARATVHEGDRPPLLFGRAAGPTHGLGSVVALPLSAAGRGEPVGVFVHGRAPGRPPLSVEERQRIEVLLRQAATALVNGRLFEEVEARAVTDGMTGLPNHRRFQEEIQVMLARAERVKGPLSLLMVDVDHFKGVNDGFGHPAGDEVLRRLARVLQRSVREGTDLAARYGGEEFAVVLENTDSRGARALAERLRETFAAERFVHSDGERTRTFRCTLSVGIATWPDDGRTPKDLIARADEALYAAKEAGRDRVVTARDAGGSLG